MSISIDISKLSDKQLQEIQVACAGEMLKRIERGEPEGYRCEECDTLFISVDNTQEHLHRVHHISYSDEEINTEVIPVYKI